jgi:hypothetical protein
MAGLTDELAATAGPVRVGAMGQLLDRGCARPAQMISGDDNAPLIVDIRWAYNTLVHHALSRYARRYPNRPRSRSTPTMSTSPRDLTHSLLDPDRC